MKYKVGDKVRVKSIEWYNKNKNEFGTVKCNGAYFQPIMSKLCENILTIKNINKGVNTYNVIENDYYWVDDMFEDLVEEKITQLLITGIIFPNKKYANKVELCLGDDYEIVVEDGRTFVQKKKPKYPTNHEECCQYLGYNDKLSANKLVLFSQLINARNAYWKIAGEQMGLSKSWEPNWNESSPKYIITVIKDKLVKHYALTQNYILAFPTVEMRDTFYKNFKELIEKCKELL